MPNIMDEANCDEQDLRASFADTLGLFLHAGSYENSTTGGDAGCFCSFNQGFCSRADWKKTVGAKSHARVINRLTIFQMRKRYIICIDHGDSMTLIQYPEMNTASLSSTAPARGMGMQDAFGWPRALELDRIHETLDHEWLPGT
jgi:hypothetical protein